MKILRAIGREVLGLFLDDEFLAAATLVVVALVAVLIKALHVPPPVAGFALLAGCVAVLCLSVRRTARTR